MFFNPNLYPGNDEGMVMMREVHTLLSNILNVW